MKMCILCRLCSVATVLCPAWPCPVRLTTNDPRNYQLEIINCQSAHFDWITNCKALVRNSALFGQPWLGCCAALVILSCHDILMQLLLEQPRQEKCTGTPDWPGSVCICLYWNVCFVLLEQYVLVSMVYTGLSGLYWYVLICNGSIGMYFTLFLALSTCYECYQNWWQNQDCLMGHCIIQWSKFVVLVVLLIGPLNHSVIKICSIRSYETHKSLESSAF